MTESDGSNSGLVRHARELLTQALRTAWELFKILVPLSVLARLLEQLGAVAWLGQALEPVMGLVGLPGKMGLVWATAMVTNLYGGMIVFAQLAPGSSLTAAQATVLGTMMLVAHALPVELRIAQKAGARLRFMLLLRVVGAIVLGWLLHTIYSCGHWLDRPNVALWQPPPQDPSWTAWAADTAVNLGWIFLIILGLLFLLRVLKAVGLTRLLTRLLEPALRLLGMSHEAAPITIIGMTLGISYGGGLIIEEARSGRVTPRDVLFSLSLMGLAHSLIEDTLLMVALGGHVSGLLGVRLVFAMIVTSLLAKLVSRLPRPWVDRHLVRGPPPDAGN